MRLNELLIERRRYPEFNPRQSVYEFLKQYKDDPNVYLHTTSVDKVGIYPKSRGHDAPIGIYAFRLQDIWEHDIERWNTGEYTKNPRGIEFLAYRGGDNVFLLRSNISHDFLKDYTEQDLKKDVDKIQKMLDMSDERIQGLKHAATTNLNFVDAPVGYLWGITKAIAAGGITEFDEYTPTNEKKWAKLLRKLGHSAFNDPGYGWIHGAEAQQSLFLDNTLYKVIDKYTIQRKKKFKIDDKEYQSIPKRLHMKTIPDLLFDNNDPEDFTRVFEWSVDMLKLDTLRNFARFLPKRATGYIKTLFIRSSDYTGYTQNVLELLEFLRRQPNIKVDTLYMGMREPGAILSQIDDINVKTIKISQFSSIPDFYMNEISPQIQNKIKND